MEATIDALKEIIRPGDLHLVFDQDWCRCVIWRRTEEGGDALGAVPMYNRTVREGFGHDGHCPRGTYILGAPSDCHVISLGDHFTPLFDLDPAGPMHQDGRAAIGIHGGGTGAQPGSFAPEQTIIDTEGCLRVHNRDNDETLVPTIRAAHAAGHRAFITVQGGTDG